ncbi:MULTISPECIES: hypothetical protein [unclassified Francisella]|nr:MULTISPECIES: hypothetical protein [unclassified Francisella]MED7820354.1 hypothetical protein [Francisella sp. 19S2-4]MED7831193.1 hypothetical protein [Francisella sp. 19S2-10]
MRKKFVSLLLVSSLTLSLNSCFWLAVGGVAAAGGAAGAYIVDKK